eukprot:scaffold804_cov165-Amphora_coffeaeformis.AAC.3
MHETQESLASSFDDWSLTHPEGNNSHHGRCTAEGGEATSVLPLGGDDDATMLIDSIPSSLHPAVSMGMRRVSSCYFSVKSEGSNSVVDLLSLWDERDNNELMFSEGEQKSATMEEAFTDAPSQGSWSPSPSSDLLYHDILMNVFTYLDAPSLSAVSETARRLNFEVFYFLELQLQRALIPGRIGDNGLSSIAGVSIIQRLANWNRAEAEGVVQQFLDSNASLRHMPLSHSLAYMRQVFQNNTKFPHSPSSQALASAALLVTLLGAASSFQMPEISSEIPNMVLRLGFVGSLMGAAKSMTEPERLRERAEQMKQQASVMAERLQTAAADAHFPSWSDIMHLAQHRNAETESPSSGFLLSHDPYAHVSTSNGTGDTTLSNKTPTGCIGAYLRTVSKASRCITNHVRESRQQRFKQFSTAERQALTRQFLEACTSNDSLDQVKTIVNNGVPVDGFFVGADGSETCALHTAAFNGAGQVIDYLCSGIDDESSTSSCNKDGGLCDVNCRDANAWTALHFAAGSNSVEAVRVLVKHGADWTVEANNGYTPYQWAVRLKHHQVAKELKDLASQNHLRNHRWMSHRPLSAIASRFFTFVMVQSN